MKAIIETPVKHYDGIVAGLRFVDGKAEDDNVTEAQLAYFKRHEYKVKILGDQSKAPKAEAKAEAPKAEEKPAEAPKAEAKK